MMDALSILKTFFSADMVIYAAIIIIALTALARCTLPLSRVAGQAAPRGAHNRDGKQAEQGKEIVERYPFSWR